MTTVKPTTTTHGSAIIFHHTICARETPGETESYQSGHPHGSLWVELFSFKLGSREPTQGKPQLCQLLLFHKIIIKKCAKQTVRKTFAFLPYGVEQLEGRGKPTQASFVCTQVKMEHCKEGKCRNNIQMKILIHDEEFSNPRQKNQQ